MAPMLSAPVLTNSNAELAELRTAIEIFDASPEAILLTEDGNFNEM
mgnify:CR=1 FL=1